MQRIHFPKLCYQEQKGEETREYKEEVEGRNIILAHQISKLLQNNFEVSKTFEAERNTSTGDKYISRTRYGEDNPGFF